MLLRPRPIDTCKSPSRPQIKSGALRASTSPSYCKYTPQPLEKQVAPGNCIKLGQTHVRLPESGRGTPCGCPSSGHNPRGLPELVGAPLVGAQGHRRRTVQIVVRYRKFHTSLATGGRFLGRKKKTIGRGALRRHFGVRIDASLTWAMRMSPNRTAGRLKWVLRSWTTCQGG